MGRSWRLLACVVLLGAAITGCGEAGTDDGPRADGPPPDAMARLPERLLLPSTPPEGFLLREVDSGLFDGRPFVSDNGVMTLYGAADVVDPLSEPFLAVLWSAGSETRPFLPGQGGPREVAEGFRPVEVQGHHGAVGSVGDDLWVTWWPPDEDQEQDSYAVLGRGLIEEQVLHAAAQARIVPPESAVISRAGLPAGFSALATGPVAVDVPVVTPSVRYRYTDGGTASIVETAAAGGVGTELLARATIAGEQRRIRGVDGSVGRPRYNIWDVDSLAYPPVRYAWAEDGLVVVVDGYNVPPEAVEDFVNGLRPVPAADALGQLPATLARYRPESLLQPGEAFAVGANVPGAVWAIGVQRDPTTSGVLLVSAPHIYLTPEGLAYSGGQGDFLAEDEIGLPAGFDGNGNVFIAGNVPESVVRAELRLPDGSVVPAPVGRVPGIRSAFLGVFTSVAGQKGVMTVVGYDAAGREMLLAEHIA